MTELLRYRVNWGGPSGGQGLTTLHIARSDLGTFTVTNANNVHTRVRLFFENTSEWLPNDIRLTFPADSDIISAETGDLERTVTASSPAAQIDGALTGNWQNGVGTRVVWATGVVVLGRRRKGFTYLVPYGSIFDTDGTLNSTAASDITTNASSLISGLQTDSMNLVVYSELRHQFSSVIGASLTDKPVILRTRRD